MRTGFYVDLTTNYRKSTPKTFGVQEQNTKYSWCSETLVIASIIGYERGHLLQIRKKDYITSTEI